MKPHITMIPLGVDEFDRAVEFYQHDLGLPRQGDSNGTRTLNGSYTSARSIGSSLDRICTEPIPRRIRAAFYDFPGPSSPFAPCSSSNLTTRLPIGVSS